MPLPFILGLGAVIAGAAGVGSGINGAMKIKDANDTIKSAERQHKENIARFEATSERTNTIMDNLGKLELNILKSFEKFSDVIEKIQNRPQFKSYSCRCYNCCCNGIGYSIYRNCYCIFKWCCSN